MEVVFLDQREGVVGMFKVDVDTLFQLPFGGLAAAAVFFLLPARQPSRQEGQESGWRGLKRLDFVGAALVLTLITCLLLALQWGGNEYPWTSKWYSLPSLCGTDFRRLANHLSLHPWRCSCRRVWCLGGVA